MRPAIVLNGVPTEMTLLTGLILSYTFKQTQTNHIKGGRRSRVWLNWNKQSWCERSLRLNQYEL